MNHTKVHNITKYQSNKQVDENDFLEDLKSMLYILCEVFDYPNDSLACWKSPLMDIVNLHAPLKEREG